MIIRIGYNNEKYTKVRVCGIECDFSDMRIDRNSVPKKRYHYDVAGDDDSQSEPSKVGQGIMVNFFRTLISDALLPLVDDNELWLQEGS